MNPNTPKPLSDLESVFVSPVIADIDHESSCRLLIHLLLEGLSFVGGRDADFHASIESLNTKSG
ncbi:MAG TPA: hypothetical protein PKW66_02210, partial [Polyangiaceae bacterium]|nr:hypothetical protein [Polyangiaceae bacterium]